jgi:hypothetical protein
MARGVSERVNRRIQREFPHHPQLVATALSGLTCEVTNERWDAISRERLQVSVLLLARGHLARLDEAIACGYQDWRDLLLSAGLAEKNWQAKAEAELSPPGAGHIW